MAGPLHGVRVIELAGIGPCPYAAMLLADMGADVVRVDRAGAVGRDDGGERNVSNRGRRSLALDLKHPDAVEVLLRMVEGADVLIEGFRPGVVERLGIGPEVALARNPRLVYGRMTGWGQEGPYASEPGHDVNFLALAGALDSLRRRDEVPVPPLNLVGDFGGGAMFLVFGVACALLDAHRTGQGQVVDAAMVDGVASLTSLFHGLRAMGQWGDVGTNALDTGSHFYEVYETADGRFVSIGASEPQFYANLVARLGLDLDELPPQMDTATWPAMKERFRAIFKERTRDEWTALLEGAEACFAPVLTFDEAPQHPHIRARSTYVEADGVVRPAAAPRFSRSDVGSDRPPSLAGADSVEVLEEWGWSTDEVAGLVERGAVARRS